MAIGPIRNARHYSTIVAIWQKPVSLLAQRAWEADQDAACGYAGASADIQP